MDFDDAVEVVVVGIEAVIDLGNHAAQVVKRGRIRDVIWSETVVSIEAAGIAGCDSGDVALGIVGVEVQ